MAAEQKPVKAKGSFSFMVIILGVMAGLVGALAAPWVKPYLPVALFPQTTPTNASVGGEVPVTDEFQLAFQQAMAQVGTQTVTNREQLQLLEQELKRLVATQQQVIVEIQSLRAAEAAIPQPSAPVVVTEPVVQPIEAGPSPVAEALSPTVAPRKVLGGLIKIQKEEQ